MFVLHLVLAFSPRPPAAASLPAGSKLPRLVVFDLDNTLWLPELYQHNRRHNGRAPVAGVDVNLLPGAVSALHELNSCELWQGCQIAVASRTNQGDWARALLREFRAPGDESRSLAQTIACASLSLDPRTSSLCRPAFPWPVPLTWRSVDRRLCA